MSYLSESIKSARKNAGLSQLELAQKIGKSISSVQKYEQGTVVPSFDILSSIAFACGLSSMQAFGIQNSKDTDYIVRQFETQISPLMDKAKFMDEELFAHNPSISFHSMNAICMALKGIHHICDDINIYLGSYETDLDEYEHSDK